MKRRILAILLACMMVVSVFPMTAFAEGEPCAAHTAKEEEFVKTVAPTCTTIGYDLYKCATCGEHYAANFEDVTDHDYSVALADTAVGATCTTAGKEADMQCSACDAIQEGATVEALGHTENGVALDGVCGGYKCGRCGEDIGEGEHVWSEHPKIVTEPSSTTLGSAQFTCTNEGCDAVKNVPIMRQCAGEHNLGSQYNFTYTPCGEKPVTVRWWYCYDCYQYFYYNTENTLVMVGDYQARSALEAEWKAMGHETASKTIEPTCTERGAIIEICTKCGTEVKAQVVGYLGHDWADEVSRHEDATCELPAYDYYSCSRCEEERQVQVAPPTGHSRTHVTVSATCMAPSYYYIICSNDHCEYDAISEYTIEHDGVSYTVDVTVDGEAVQVIKNTYYVWNEETQKSEQVEWYVDMSGSVDLNNHVWSLETVSKNPTCDQPGTKVLICTEHGVTKPEEIPALGHSYVLAEDVEEIVATCVVDGYKLEICSICGHKKETTTPAYGSSNNVYDSYEDALAEHAGLVAKEDGSVLSAGNCVTFGYASYACATCNNNVVAKIEGTGAGHVWDTAAVADTCTGKGATAGGKCTKCDAELEIVEIDEITDHSWTTVSEAVDNCDEGAINALQICDNCGATHEEYNGATTREPGHSYTVLLNPGWNDTCQSNGRTPLYQCERCDARDGGIYYNNIYNHAIDAPAASREANCTEFGCVYWVCGNGENCNYQNGYITNYVPAYGHDDANAEVLEPVDATCTTTGLTEGSKCPNCDYVFVEQEEIEMLPHQNLAGETLEDKCTNDVEDRLCVNGCENKIEKSHTALRTLVDIPATCTEDGYTITICDACGGEEEVKTVVPALGHDMSDWIVDEEPTVEAAGKKHKECSRCDYTEEDTIPALAKDLAFAITVDNVNASGKGYTDSSLISVTIAISAEEGKSVDIWGLQYELSYDADALTFVGIEQASDKFAAVTYNAADGAVTMIASTADGAATSNATITDEAYVLATLQFRVTTASGAVELKAEAESIDADGYALDVAPATESIDVEAFMDVDAKDGVNLADLLAAYEAAIAGEYNVVADVDKSGALDFEDILNICEYLVGAYAYEDMTALGQ